MSLRDRVLVGLATNDVTLSGLPVYYKMRTANRLRSLDDEMKISAEQRQRLEATITRSLQVNDQLEMLSRRLNKRDLKRGRLRRYAVTLSLCKAAQQELDRLVGEVEEMKVDFGLDVVSAETRDASPEPMPPS